MSMLRSLLFACKFDLQAAVYIKHVRSFCLMQHPQLERSTLSLSPPLLIMANIQAADRDCNFVPAISRFAHTDVSVQGARLWQSRQLNLSLRLGVVQSLCGGVPLLRIRASLLAGKRARRLHHLAKLSLSSQSCHIKHIRVTTSLTWLLWSTKAP